MENRSGKRAFPWIAFCVMAIAALAVSLGNTACTQAETSKDEDEKPKITLTMKLNKSTYKIGERMKVTVTIKDASKEEVELYGPTLDARSLWFDIETPGGKKFHICKWLTKAPSKFTLKKGKRKVWKYEMPAIMAGKFKLTARLNATGDDFLGCAADPKAFAAKYPNLTTRSRTKQEYMEKKAKIDKIMKDFMTKDLFPAEGVKSKTKTFKVKDGSTSKKPGRKMKAKFETNYGTMVAELWPNVAYNTVLQFAEYARSGGYKNKKFHRVIKKFMIQGGCPKGTGGGSPGFNLQPEFSKKKHVKGILSTARTQFPAGAGCQFFVMTQTSPHLDEAYAVWGKLIGGEDVLDKIASVAVGGPQGSSPLTPVELKDMKIVYEK